MTLVKVAIKCPDCHMILCKCKPTSQPRFELVDTDVKPLVFELLTDSEIWAKINNGDEQ